MVNKPSVNNTTNMPELSHYCRVTEQRLLQPDHQHQHALEHVSCRSMSEEAHVSPPNEQQVVPLRNLLERAHHDLKLCKYWIDELKKQNRVLKDEKEELQAMLEAKVAEDASQSREIMRLSHELQILKLQMLANHSGSDTAGHLASDMDHLNESMGNLDLSSDQNVVFMFGASASNT